MGWRQHRRVTKQFPISEHKWSWWGADCISNAQANRVTWATWIALLDCETSASLNDGHDVGWCCVLGSWLHALQQQLPCNLEMLRAASRHKRCNFSRNDAEALTNCVRKITVAVSNKYIFGLVFYLLRRQQAWNALLCKRNNYPAQFISEGLLLGNCLVQW